MFKKAIFHFSEPICNCEQSDLDWTVDYISNKISLCAVCQTCKSTVIVPQEKFLACFLFDKPYPKGQKSKNKTNGSQTS